MTLSSAVAVLFGNFSNITWALTVFDINFWQINRNYIVHDKR